MQLSPLDIAYLQVLILIGSFFLFLLTLWRAQRAQFNLANQIQDFKVSRVEGHLFDTLAEVNDILSEVSGILYATEDRISSDHVDGTSGRFIRTPIGQGAKKWSFYKEELMKSGNRLMKISWLCGKLRESVFNIGVKLKEYSPGQSGIVIPQVEDLVTIISSWLMNVMNEGFKRFDVNIES